jgi:hypothetical protein
VLSRLGCEMACSREGREVWRVGNLDNGLEKMKNKSLRVEGTDGVGLGTNKVA